MENEEEGDKKEHIHVSVQVHVAKPKEEKVTGIPQQIVQAEQPLSSGPVTLEGYKRKQRTTTFHGLVEQSVSHAKDKKKMKGITIR